MEDQGQARVRGAAGGAALRRHRGQRGRRALERVDLNRAGRAPAALRRRPLRRHATPRRSDSTRCRGRSPPAAAQPPVPRGSAAARLAQHARSGRTEAGWAPDMSRPHHPRTAPHTQRGETTLRRAAHRSYGKVLGGSAGRQQQRARTAVVWRQKSCWAPVAIYFEDATRRIFAFLAHRRRSQENRKTWLRRIFPARR